MLKEFQEFARKGNVADLAAFGRIVDPLAL
jgi:large-conductance mechanosensitive channel